ncbi:MAG: PIN domain-containing protein, partial [Nitrospirae bacterium]|nr:PIN domain-containing protein [Nitrospirota bacterium]
PLPKGEGVFQQPPREVLLDTNVLVYAHNEDAPQHRAAKALRDDALDGRIRACLAHQNLLELFAVVTNPRRVERPLSPVMARDLADLYLAQPAFRLIHPTEETSAWLLGLLKEVPVRGARVFDLFLAATMLTNGVTAIATFNGADFSRVPGISVFEPGDP